ncbi:biotin/lipoyl-containing protein, partial [Ligilactobacillus salivarius]|uniref:biotin/lipoyl-containing protein n=1 Tax=Ligilactobacillus salivarius TaxID=1624 RepID=UPI0023B10F8C
FQFKLPDIGEGIHEGEIVKWLVKEGEKLSEDDVLCEVQNDKAVVEIPSPVSGTVEKIHVKEGQVAIVGDVLVSIDAPGYEDMQFKGEHEEEKDVKLEENKKDSHTDLGEMPEDQEQKQKQKRVIAMT